MNTHNTNGANLSITFGLKLFVDGKHNALFELSHTSMFIHTEIQSWPHLDNTFGAITLPSWAGQPHESSFAKAKAKPKAKAKAGSARPDATSRRGGGDGAGGRPKKGEDPEIAKIMVQRDALLTSRKWSSEISVLSKKVSHALEAAKGYEGTEEFLDHSFREIRVAVMFCVWVSG